MTYFCEWFALCENPATGTIDHPILGPVPTCDRCAAKYHDLGGDVPHLKEG